MKGPAGRIWPAGRSLPMSDLNKEAKREATIRRKHGKAFVFFNEIIS